MWHGLAGSFGSFQVSHKRLLFPPRGLMAEVAVVMEVAPAAADDRVRMECDRCGYVCVPQWLNDKAHCLKCQAVLRTRGSLHEAKKEVFGAEANGEGRRQCGEVSTFKMAPSSAMESESGSCSKAPDGVHHWKYGKCNFCQQAEGKLAKGPGVMQNPGGVTGCEKGGKCMFKFAKCTKCGRGELKGGEERRFSNASTASTGASKSPRTQAQAQPTTQPRAQSPPLAAAAGLVMKDAKPEEEVTKKMSKDSKDSKDGEARKTSKGETRKTSKAGTEDRTKLTCHVCGYKSVPQWLNDKAHCLKCDAILKTRASIHGDFDLPENRQKDVGASRASGEVSTYKESPGSAMESASGSCSKAPDGLHHWKYGKCNVCQQPEGKLVKGAGVIANPGGAAGCSKDGGKCMFKFSKCTKCGKKEF